MSFWNGFPRVSEQGGVIEVPETASQDRRLHRTVEQYLDVSVEVDKHVLLERVSERISVQGGVIGVPETASQDRRFQRTVQEHLDVSVEVDKNVFQERISEGMRDQIIRKHLQCSFKVCGFGCTLSSTDRVLAALR